MEGPKVGGGEVRKVHVLYFLSHNGKIEQPHLIRVHHLCRNGVHLRDVKRWLYDLRGKDMPDSYAWSYKRRYRSGYVWQDLTDDDLITPISDDEYVLKGSNISSKSELPPLETIKTITEEEEAKLVLAPKTPTRPEMPPQQDHEPSGDVHPPPLSISDMSDESATLAATVKIDSWTQCQVEQKKEREKANAKRRQAEAAADGGTSWLSRRRTSNLLHKLFACRGVETNNSVLTIRSPKKDPVSTGQSSHCY